MPIYLSRYIGTGTIADPCRPIGSDQPGWAAIDLRADSGATLAGNGLNACLLSLPIANPDSRLYQLASVNGEDVPVSVRAGLAARLNATLNYTRLDDLIADLLLRPPARAWQPLRDRADQQLEIHLGGLLSPSPALRALAAKIYTETWSTGNAAGLTSDLTWTEYLGTGFELFGNRARMASINEDCGARADHDTDTDGQVVVATLSTLTFSGGFDYALLTCRNPSTATKTFYSLTATRESTPLNEWHLDKCIAGTFTNLGINATNPAAGDHMQVSAVNNSIQGMANSTVLSTATDTGITGNTRAGLAAYISQASGLIEFDNWRVRDAYGAFSLASSGAGR